MAVVAIDEQLVAHAQLGEFVAPQAFAHRLIQFQCPAIGIGDEHGRGIAPIVVLGDTGHAFRNLLAEHLPSRRLEVEGIEAARLDGITQRRGPFEDGTAGGLAQDLGQLKTSTTQTEGVFEIVSGQGRRLDFSDRRQLGRIADEQELCTRVRTVPAGPSDAHVRNQVSQQPTGTEAQEILFVLPIADHGGLVYDEQDVARVFRAQGEVKAHARVILGPRLFEDLQPVQRIDLTVNSSAVRPCLVPEDACCAARRREKPVRTVCRVKPTCQRGQQGRLTRAGTTLQDETVLRPHEKGLDRVGGLLLVRGQLDTV